MDTMPDPSMPTTWPTMDTPSNYWFATLPKIGISPQISWGRTTKFGAKLVNIFRKLIYLFKKRKNDEN